MTFLIHYIVKTRLKDIHFDIVSSSPVSKSSLPSLRAALAKEANLKVAGPTAEFFPEDIVIANIIPMPDRDAEPKQIGGS